jgi:Ca2+-binding EF-hand superfamily protein
MLRRTNIVLVILVIAVLAAAGAMLGTAAVASKSQEKLLLGEDEVKQLLLLMDADQNGKISRQEYMKFMEAEFELLDKDKSGELDVKELTHSRLKVNRSRSR